jgi:hypothetical protein
MITTIICLSSLFQSPGIAASHHQAVGTLERMVRRYVREVSYSNINLKISRLSVAGWKPANVAGQRSH